MSYVNQARKDDELKDIYDYRIPIVDNALSDKNKVIKVDENGNYELGNVILSIGNKTGKIYIGSGLNIDDNNVMTVSSESIVCDSELSLTSISPVQNKVITQNINTINSTLNTKQGTLTAGDNIQINGTTISATDTKYTTGTGLNLAGGQISVDTDVIPTKSYVNDGLALKQDKLYQHNIYMHKDSDSSHLAFTIINTQSTEMLSSNIATYFNTYLKGNVGVSSVHKAIQCVGYTRTGGMAHDFTFKISANDSNENLFTSYTISSTGSTTTSSDANYNTYSQFTIQDTVIAL